MSLSCGDSLVLTAGNGDKTGQVEAGAGDCVSEAGRIVACSVQDCENFLCFGDVHTVSKND